MCCECANVLQAIWDCSMKHLNDYRSIKRPENKNCWLKIEDNIEWRHLEGMIELLQVLKLRDLQISPQVLSF